MRRGLVTLGMVLGVGTVSACTAARPPSGLVEPAPSAAPPSPPGVPASDPPAAPPGSAPTTIPTASATTSASSAPAPGPAAPVCKTQIVAPPLAAQPRCDRDDQCTLVSAVCCFCGEIPRTEVRAAHIDGRLSACKAGTVCPACAASPPDGITAACLHHVCRGVEKICK